MFPTRSAATPTTFVMLCAQELARALHLVANDVAADTLICDQYLLLLPS
jgi:hypothetical protein